MQGERLGLQAEPLAPENSCNRDERQLVVIKLLVNAIEAMPDGGILKTSAVDRDQADMPPGIRLTACDSCPGIGPAISNTCSSPSSRPRNRAATVSGYGSESPWSNTTAAA